jgi:8-oxo-dGTP diphosphatase
VVIREADLQVLSVVHRPSYGHNRVYWDTYLRATAWSGTPTNMEPGKCGGLEFHHPHALPADTIDHVAEVLHRTLVRQETFIELGWRCQQASIGGTLA